MADVSIRNLNNRVREKLRIRAAGNGRSMEAEMRTILEDAVADPNPSRNLLDAIFDRFQEIGGVELEIRPRSTPPRAPDFSA